MGASRLPTFFISHGGGPWPWMKAQTGGAYDQLEHSLVDIKRQLGVRRDADDVGADAGRSCHRGRCNVPQANEHHRAHGKMQSFLTPFQTPETVLHEPDGNQQREQRKKSDVDADS